MNNRLLLTSALLAFGLALSSCTSTIPNAAQMDMYYEKATALAQKQIDLVNAQKARGEITQEDYDLRMASINAGISKQAGDMAWARHEIAESQMRAQGIPTGDAPVRVEAPSQNGMESFYRPYSDAGNSLNNSTSSTGNQLNFRQGQSGSSMWRGYTPGTMASQASQRSAGGY